MNTPIKTAFDDYVAKVYDEGLPEKPGLHIEQAFFAGAKAAVSEIRGHPFVAREDAVVMIDDELGEWFANWRKEMKV